MSEHGAKGRMFALCAPAVVIHSLVLSLTHARLLFSCVGTSNSCAKSVYSAPTPTDQPTASTHIQYNEVPLWIQRYIES